MNTISNFSVELPISNIKRRLKVPPDKELTKYDWLITQFFSLVKPIARYEKLRMEVVKDYIVFDGSYRIDSHSLYKHLSNCCHVTLLGVNIGMDVEEEMKRYQREGKILEPFLLDAVGSESVEACAAHVSGLISVEIESRGFKPTKRFSPGYGDLKLQVQTYFFEKLKLEEIGMTLTDSMLMVPLKSVTAFIGWRRYE